MARRRRSNRRRRRGGFGFLYKLLSVLAICAVVILALTLFFRMNVITVTGNQRYTKEEIIEAAGVETGDNLYLLNKNEAVNNILQKLPYIEEIRINRKLPDTLLIDVKECGTPLAIVQDGAAWLISPGGKIMEQISAAEADKYAVIDGCSLLAPTVGTKIALSTEYTTQQTSLLELLAALEEEGMLEQVDAIHLEDLSTLTMDYDGRFTIVLKYDVDYSHKMEFLREILNSDKIQSNETGTIQMTREDGQANFIPNTR